ncbi:FAD-dependent monooxygenase [Microbispora sitophila]|uniref:FAD-dependent monooxygenase n=1 Tax=Microbispora sitophila TaxID=2771537 RepID=UPI00384D32CA
MQDAVNLGWKLAVVVRGQAPDVLLGTYQAERHPSPPASCTTPAPRPPSGGWTITPPRCARCWAISSASMRHGCAWPA